LEKSGEQKGVVVGNLRSRNSIPAKWFELKKRVLGI